MRAPRVRVSRVLPPAHRAVIASHVSTLAPKSSVQLLQVVSFTQNFHVLPPFLPDEVSVTEDTRHHRA
jgi:hypothetical protein